jgi:uncharacterized cupin superfamily protein
MAHEKLIFRAKDRATTPEGRHSHSWNINSEMRGHMLGDKVGLKRIGIHHITIPPGKENFVFHSHQTEEEFLFVLSGRAVIEIEDETHGLEPGDFVGFPTPSVAHHVRNPFDEPFTYLSGGERRDVEIADFPRHGRRMVRIGDKVDIYPHSARKSFEEAAADFRSGDRGG